MLSNTQDYDQNYIEACFRIWYQSGAPGLKTSNGKATAAGAHIMKILPPAPDGRKPNIVTVDRWIDRYAWRERADALDAEVSVRLDKEAIEERIQTLKILAENGKTLKQKGLDYLNKGDNPFADNPSAAVRAIVAGSEMEFKYSGAANKLLIISQMSDDQVQKEILRLLGKESQEPDNDENTIDAVSEDIPSEDDDSTENDDS